LEQIGNATIGALALISASAEGTAQDRAAVREAPPRAHRMSIYGERRDGFD